MDHESFKSPGSEYRGIALWMLNDSLEEEEVSRQLAGFREAGWGAVIGRTFNGLLTEYLGDEWMRITRRVIEQSREQGTRMWLQAGYMPSGMPELAPEHTLTGLTRVPVAEAGGFPPDRVLAEHDDFLYILQSAPGVLDLLNPDAVKDYLELAYARPWHSRFGEHFGKTVEAVWVDEPHFRPPLMPWCDRMPHEFRSRWGYDIGALVPALFVPVHDFRQIRHHYWRLVLEFFLEGYFRQVGRWCGEHGVKFSGHLMGEDTICDQVCWTGACMPAYEYMQLPGIDHLTRSLEWPADRKFILTPKQVSSVASQLGKREVLCEVYGVSSQGITFAERKRIFDWMAVLGINYRCYHGAFYSMRGRRKRIYAPHLSYQQPWWPENRPLADYCARLSLVLRQGRPLAEVLLLHNVESGFCHYDPLARENHFDRQTEPEELQNLLDSLVITGENLLSIQRNFEFGDETLLAKYGRVTAKGLQVEQMTYPVVILPQMCTIRASTLELLLELAGQGHLLLSVGKLPELVDGVKNNRNDELLARLSEVVTRVQNNAEALQRVLDKSLTPQYQLHGQHLRSVWIHVRDCGDERWYFACNTSPEQAVVAELAVAGGGRLEAWDPATGTVVAVPQRLTGVKEDERVTTPLDLPPLATCLLRQDLKTEAVARPRPAVEVSGRVELAARWEMELKRPNALTLDYCRVQRGDGPWSRSLPVIYQQKLLQDDDYRGPVRLEFEFEVREVPLHASVVVEDAPDWEIMVNEHRVEYAEEPYYFDRSFLPVSITHALKPGVNRIHLVRDFIPVPKPQSTLSGLFEVLPGVEIESIYVVGDFALEVAIADGCPDSRCQRLAPRFALVKPVQDTTGNLTADGYPFYAGTALLRQHLDLRHPAADERVILVMPGLDAVGLKVRMNGEDAGRILWSPCELEISPFITAGDNLLEIEVVGSLRNLLGPHHRPTGEPDECWHYSFEYYPPEDEPGKAGEDYFNVTADDQTWTHDYFCVNFGVRTGGVIEYRRTR